jgi:imidazolonepropionase-like amidohydrolase
MLAIRAARLFDGTSDRLIARPLLLVENGTITAVEANGVEPPAGLEQIDLGDVTLLPGLIDLHVHLGFDAGPDPVRQMNADDNLTLLLRMAKAARVALQAGVTTVRDLGDRDYLGVTLRDWYRSELDRTLGRDGAPSRPGGAPPAPRDIGPEILAAGPPITVTGGHCHFMNGEVDGELGIRRGVHERVKRGCDAIKVMATGGHMTPGTNPLAPQFSVPELRAAVEEAHRLNKRLTAHAHATAGIELAVEAGVDGIEHCSFQVEDGLRAEQSLIERIAAARIAVAPTIGRPAWSPMPPAFAARMEQRRAIIGRMHRAGCVLVTGTDAGIAGVPHDAAPWQVRAFADAGLSNAEAIRTATAVAAEAAGIGERKGTIAAGKDADLLAVAGNPLESLAAIHDVRAVFRAGLRVV